MRGWFALYWTLASLLSASADDVSSADGNIKVTVDDTSAFIASITLGKSAPIPVRGAWVVAGTHSVQSLVTRVIVEGKQGLRLEQVSCLAKGNACSSLRAVVTTTLLSEANTVNMTVEIEGSSTESSMAEVPWTGLVSWGFTFEDISNLKIWAPWNRGVYLDPGGPLSEPEDALLPSWGGWSWPHASMSYGTTSSLTEGPTGGYGVAAEHVTVLSPANEAAFSLIGDPENPPLTKGTLSFDGPSNGGAACTSPSECPGGGSIAMNFFSLKLKPGVVHRRQYR
jgi:hypothetical protein